MTVFFSIVELTLFLRINGVSIEKKLIELDRFKK